MSKVVVASSAGDTSGPRSGYMRKCKAKIKSRDRLKMAYGTLRAGVDELERFGASRHAPSSFQILVATTGNLS